MSYLMSISIGPVQDFIATARRTRDLWFGSWLLSDLSRSVAETIVNHHGKLIFPANTSGSVVNKILAEVDDPTTLAGECRDAIKLTLESITKIPFDTLEKRVGSIFKRQRASDQIADLVEFNWAALPLTDYPKDRKKVELLLNARKATRNFHQPTWADQVPKSSLDGQRESVIEDSEIESPRVRNAFNLRRKERLCGVGVLKRLAERDAEHFASTSHIAALPLLLSMKKGDANEEAVGKYISDLTKLLFEIEDKVLGCTPQRHPVFENYDGRLLFANRLKDFPFNSEADEQLGKDALKSFMSTVFGENREPLPYYAILMADGDRMGSVIDSLKTMEAHREISKTLGTFAAGCDDIVKRHHGCLIYAGGDDVLALLPLHTVIDCADDLRISFRDKFGDRFKDESGKSPTLSVGIAIYHHTEPLQDALATVRRAEKQAKKSDGQNKNSMAIILNKRSGGETIVSGSWDNDRKTGESFAQRMRYFIRLLAEEAIPNGVAYELRDLWNRFKDDPVMRIPMKGEALRILKRKRTEQGTLEIDKETLDKLGKLIDSERLDVGRIADEIIVARDLARAYDQAGCKPEIPEDSK